MAAPLSPDTSDDRRLCAPGAQALERLGAAVARRLRRGEAVLLWGPLGAGKSTLARGLVRALTTPDEEVPSPTFTLVQSYDGDPVVAHFDLYRLKSAAEAAELGLEEALDVGAVVIEWPERLEGALPDDRLDVVITIPQDGQGRLVRLAGFGTWAGRELDLDI
jgi:tRNA threonylcarbamoyladenosine biosynthesis protein TsaE